MSACCFFWPQCCAWSRSCPSVPARGVDHRHSATMSNASLFCGTLEPTRMRWECGQVRVTRLRKGSNCAGVQRCQVCAPINRERERERERETARERQIHDERNRIETKIAPPNKVGNYFLNTQTINKGDVRWRHRRSVVVLPLGKDKADQVPSNQHSPGMPVQYFTDGHSSRRSCWTLKGAAAVGTISAAI